MIDVANYSQTEKLKNGMLVKIRSIRPDDKDKLIQAFNDLKPESIYTRFFHHKRVLSDADLKTATEIDFENVVAFVVTVGEKANETIIGAGRYIVLKRSEALYSAELAFTVKEDYHGQGIAGMIIKHLIIVARDKGLTQFEAEVLSENKAMLTVFSRCGLPMATKRGAGSLHVTLSLTEAVG